MPWRAESGSPSARRRSRAAFVILAVVVAVFVEGQSRVAARVTETRMAVVIARVAQGRRLSVAQTLRWFQVSDASSTPPRSELRVDARDGDEQPRDCAFAVPRLRHSFASQPSLDCGAKVHAAHASERGQRDAAEAGASGLKTALPNPQAHEAFRAKGAGRLIDARQ
jgi:hypothetical protein